MDQGLFKRAVADTEDPTPGYMYREMAQWTFKDYNTQMKFIDALFKKLKPNTSVHVLQKVLRIIKIVCEIGHSEFQKELQKNTRTEVIKNFINYRGIQDVKYGDSLNEKVRQAARDAMETIFTHRKEEKLLIQSGYGNSAVASGPSTFTSGNFTSGTLSEKPMGLYGSNVSPMPDTNKWAEHMAQQAIAAKSSTATRVLSALAEKAKTGLGLASSSEVKGGFKSAKEQLYENVFKLSTTGGTSTSFSMSNAGNFKPVELGIGTSFSAPVESGSSGWKFIQEVKKGEDDSATNEVDCGSFSRQQQQQQQQLTPFQDAVQRLCLMKNTPQRVELSAFVVQCYKLGTEMIQERGAQNDEECMVDCWEELAEALDAQLAQKHSWQRRLNALVAIEALLSLHGDDSKAAATMRRGVMRYFHENPEDVQRNVLVVQATLRERAQRVVKVLGLPEVNSVTETVSGQIGAFLQSTGEKPLHGVENSMNTFSWSVPVPPPPPPPPPVSVNTPTMTEGGSSAANISGKLGRINHRGVGDKTTLKKRAPMRLNDEPQTYVTNGDNGCLGGMSHVGNNNKKTFSLDFVDAPVGTEKSSSNNSTMGGGGNLLDDLFGGTSTLTPAVKTTPIAAPPVATSPHVGTFSTTLFSENDKKSVFDFLETGTASNSAPPATVKQTSSLKSGSPPLWSNATLPAEKDSNNKKENNGVDIWKDSAASSQPMPESTVKKPLPSMLLEMQQQLQTMIANMRRDSDPNALAQLQLLLAQQQQLTTLVAQQQQQQQPQLQALWGAPSSSGVCESNLSAVSLHNHFALGATPSSSTTPSSVASNAFVQMQQEMMALLAASKPNNN